MRKDSNLLLANQLIMIKKIEKITIERQVTLDGMMTIGMLENGLKT